MGRILRITAVVALLNLLWIGFSYAKPLSFDNCPNIPFAKGRIFEVTKNGAPKSYIFGTMHSKRPDVLKLPSTASIAIIEVPHVATEVSSTEETKAAAFKLMVLPENENLFSIIGPERTPKVKLAAARYGLPNEFIQRLKPWAMASIFSLSPEEMHDITTPVLDEMIENIANENGKRHHALEKMSEQLGYFNNLSKELQLEFLDSALLEPKLSEYYKGILRESYLNGNLGKLHCVTVKLAEEQSAGLKSFVLDDLLIERNRLMVKRLSPLTRDGVFVAVGAAHLPGEEGILNLLKRQGYQVRRLSSFAQPQ